MTRLSYIACTTILATGILLAVHLADLQRDLDRELLEHVEEMMRLLEESETENRELREEVNRANELHFIRTEQRTLLASRGGRPSIPVRGPSGMTAQHLEAAFAALEKPAMAGLGQALVDAETETGVSALVLAGICALESGWGTSALAREKNNLAGLGAYDGDEYRSAIRFESRGACVIFLAELLRDRPGDSLQEIGIWYAADPGWAAKVAGCMRLIAGCGK